MNWDIRSEFALEVRDLGWVRNRDGFGLELLRLFHQQVHVVPGREADEPDAPSQILGHLHCAGADRAGASEQNNILHAHQAASAGLKITCRRYKYMRGALNNKLSSKSSIPPIPGKKLPESFTPASRLKMDSMRSPTTAAVLRIIPRQTAWSSFISGMREAAKCANTTLASVETTIAPPKPSHV